MSDLRAEIERLAKEFESIAEEHRRAAEWERRYRAPEEWASARAYAACGEKVRAALSERLTRAEAALLSARESALDEAARWHDRQARLWASPLNEAGRDEKAAGWHRCQAAEIRALSSSPSRAPLRSCLWHADCDAADRALRPGVDPSHPPLFPGTNDATKEE